MGAIGPVPWMEYTHGTCFYLMVRTCTAAVVRLGTLSVALKIKCALKMIRGTKARYPKPIHYPDDVSIEDKVFLFHLVEVFFVPWFFILTKLDSFTKRSAVAQIPVSCKSQSETSAASE